MAVLTPTPKMQFESASGVPLSGGKVYTYAAGTTTPQATYTDYTGATPNANPVILDSRGEAAIWLGSASYKFKLTDANDVEIWVVDYISAPTSGVSPILSGNVIIDSDTPGVALKITQTGTGAVLRVQDSADPDATPFIIDNAGNVGIGTATPSVQLEVTGAAKIGSVEVNTATIGSLSLTSAPLPIASGGTAGITALAAFDNLKQAATETYTGVIELATSAEATAGTDAARALTPATLRSAVNTTGTAPIYAPRAWVVFNGSGTIAIRASGNVTSITDNAAGDYTINFTTALPSANYASMASISSLATFLPTVCIPGALSAGSMTAAPAPTASAVRMAIQGASPGTTSPNPDPLWVSVVIVGG